MSDSTKKRSYRILVLLETPQSTMTYKLRRLAPESPDVAKVYQMDRSDGTAGYTVKLFKNAQCQCTCTGWNYRYACKHVDFCIHLGLLDPEAQKEEKASTEALHEAMDRIEELKARLREKDEELGRAVAALDDYREKEMLDNPYHQEAAHQEAATREDLQEVKAPAKPKRVRKQKQQTAAEVPF